MQKPLETLIVDALSSMGEQLPVNQAYFAFLKASLLLPIEQGSLEDPKVLFLHEDEQIVLPVFSQQKYLSAWASDEIHKISVYELKGSELISGLGDNVTLAFNPGTSSYKLFSPEEILKLKTIVSKMKQLIS